MIPFTSAASGGRGFGSKSASSGGSPSNRIACERVPITNAESAQASQNAIRVGEGRPAVATLGGGVAARLKRAYQ